jgi:hypothetical protein
MRPGREADHSPPTSAEVKKMWIYTSTPHTSSWRSAYLVKHGDSFAFYFASSLNFTLGSHMIGLGFVSDTVSTSG